jgi:hypothetical protein
MNHGCLEQIGYWPSIGRVQALFFFKCGPHFGHSCAEAYHQFYQNIIGALSFLELVLKDEKSSYYLVEKKKNFSPCVEQKSLFIR